MQKWTGAITLGVFATVVALVFAYGDTGAILAGALHAGVGTMALAAGLSIVIIALSAAKLKLMIPTVRVATLFEMAMISQFYTFFFLGQASGEAVKIYMVSRLLGRVSGAMIAIMADRFTSLIGLLIVSVLGFAFSPSDYPTGFQELSVTGLVIVVGLLIALRHRGVFLLVERTASWINRSAPRLSALAGFLQHAIEQWHVCVGDMCRIGAGVSMGALMHVGNTLVVIILARTVGIEVNFFDWCWVIGLMSIAGLVPITTGNLTAYGTMVALLQLLSVPLANAVAVSLLILAIHFPMAMLGAVLEYRRWHRLITSTAAVSADTSRQRAE